MKRFFIVWISFSMLLMACNNKKTAETTGDPKKDSVTKQDEEAAKLKEADQQMEKMKDELTKLTPLSLDELKALVPENLMGAQRKSIDASSGAGANMAVGEYAINDSMSVVLTIFDCAGPGGSGIYTQQFQGLQSNLQETEEEYLKSTEINGAKGFEHCDKLSNNCTVTFFTGKRYLIALEGTKVGAPALREAASQLRFK
jgi:hypothetical protein